MRLRKPSNQDKIGCIIIGVEIIIGILFFCWITLKRTGVDSFHFISTAADHIDAKIEITHFVLWIAVGLLMYHALFEKK
ncbi:hypothetical protein [Maridesulfovibrio sp.]|uniref:hypothetical protein n=1 Tax=unclassified Maridesulfovibrio TaxID=2794999 RepID=UPI003B007551